MDQKQPDEKEKKRPLPAVITRRVPAGCQVEVLQPNGTYKVFLNGVEQPKP